MIWRYAYFKKHPCGQKPDFMGHPCESVCYCRPEKRLHHKLKGRKQTLNLNFKPLKMMLFSCKHPWFWGGSRKSHLFFYLTKGVQYTKKLPKHPSQLQLGIYISSWRTPPDPPAFDGENRLNGCAHQPLRSSQVYTHLRQTRQILIGAEENKGVHQSHVNHPTSSTAILHFRILRLLLRKATKNQHSKQQH